MSTKKVILFIVEGITDETSLGPIINNILDKEKVLFYISDGDITSYKFTNAHNAVEKVYEHVKKFLDRYSYNKSDLLKIVHLIDTDGAYISEDKICVKDVEGFIYSTDCISAKSKELVIDRNNRKKKVINRLAACPKISEIPYFMYYFSCNLEHVLHNEINLDNELKYDYAENFSDEFYKREAEFVNFINNDEFAVKGAFKETWDFIKKDNNSLNRYTNFHLFFK